jgi:cytidylate kinase
MNIAIDGPSGAGKTTLARSLAEVLGILYLDTGAMYRAIGLCAVENGLDTKDEAGIASMLERISLNMDYRNGVQRVLVDGRDVSALIRTPRISMAASDVSALLAVRRKLVAMQREIAAGQDIVLDGRDIGTNVLPGADYKFFVTASPQRGQKKARGASGQGGAGGVSGCPCGRRQAR